MPVDTTTPADTTTVPRDTIPPPTLPDLPSVGPTGWGVGVWEWQRRDLLMLADLSVLDLLERLPGITPVRAGAYGQPEGASVFATAGGGIRYVLDGFTLDPLTTPTFDPSRLPLLALARIRVERRVTGAVVEMESLDPSDPRPHSIVEAATGDVGVNLFRGIFLAPDVLGGPLSLGFERLAAGAIGTSNLTTGWLKWTFVRDSAGIQVEYRQSEMDRTGVQPAFLGKRSDWAVRARARLLGLSTEAYAGVTTVEDDDGVIVLREGTPQGGVRAYRSLGGAIPVDVRAALRLRDHPRLPALEAELEAWAAPLPWLGAGVSARQGWWRAGDPTLETSFRARVGPVAGVALTGELSSGAPGAARFVAPVDSLVIRPDPAAARVGVALDRWGLRAGVAALRLEASEAAGFGVGFDPTAPTYPAGEATGLEATVSLPTGWAPLRVEGWYVGMEAPDLWLYTPDTSWRAGLRYDHSPLPSGNLEIHARVEHAFRGRMAAPCAPPLGCSEADGDGVVSVGSYRATNLELTIRVVTVRAFVRWENVLNRPYQQDLPFGYPSDPGTEGRFSLPGQHILYGVKWEFWN